MDNQKEEPEIAIENLLGQDRKLLPKVPTLPPPPHSGEKHNTRIDYAKLTEYYGLMGINVADLSGASRAAMSSWVHGRCAPKSWYMQMLARSLNLNLSELLMYFGSHPLPPATGYVILLQDFRPNKKTGKEEK